MISSALSPDRLRFLCQTYRNGLLDDVVPFWMKHGLDRQCGGLLTGLNEDGSVIETDKAIWLQGRATWTFATLYNDVEARPEWKEASKHCLAFIRSYGRGPAGKLYFLVTREGKPLRMRRYAYSECFATIGAAAYAKAAGDQQAAEEALGYFRVFLHHTFTPGVMPPKVEPTTRASKGVASLMIAIATAQEVRKYLGDVDINGRTCSQWIEWAIGEIERDFFRPDERVLLEQVGADGQVQDHFDGRTLNPGHAIECAWFILHEAKFRPEKAAWRKLGLAILDCMWERGWDREFGGLLYFTDLRGLPVQEYWAEMKFWWPHNEAVIATLLAYQMTGEEKYARMHTLVHDWAHRVFPDPVHGEWFGYAHRDGRIATRLKGNLWKGPFHLPRMQWYCWRLTEELLGAPPKAPEA